MGSRDPAHPLRSTLSYLEREAARRAKGTHPGMMRLQDDELTAPIRDLDRFIAEAEGPDWLHRIRDARGGDEGRGGRCARPRPAVYSLDQLGIFK